MDFVVALGTLAILAILLLTALRMPVSRWPQTDEADYPPGHSQAELIISEQNLNTDDPVPLTGRPDEVYRHPAGYLISVETKKRSYPRVYDSDRIQLSAYAVLLKHATHQSLPGGQDRAVADYGFMRLVTPHGTRWQTVWLLGENEVVRLANRQYALQQGRVVPRPTSHPAICRHCPYRQHCPESLV